MLRAAVNWSAGLRPGALGWKHPTPNIKHPTSNALEFGGWWSLWMLDVFVGIAPGRRPALQT